jgi:hypothetical protein
MTNHWLILVGNPGNFVKCNSKSLWLIKNRWPGFLDNVKEGDKLWFIRNREFGDLYNGKIIAVADFVSKNKRDFNKPLLVEDAGRGLANEGPNCDIEIHYSNLYNLTTINLYTGLRRHATISNSENIKKGFLVNYIEEYERIAYYSQITNSM